MRTMPKKIPQGVSHTERASARLRASKKRLDPWEHKWAEANKPQAVRVTRYNADGEVIYDKVDKDPKGALRRKLQSQYEVENRTGAY